MEKHLRDFLRENVNEENFQSFAEKLLQEDLASIIHDTGLPDRIAEHIFKQLRQTMLSSGEDDWGSAQQFLKVDNAVLPQSSMWKMQAYSFTTFMGFGLLCYCLSKIARKCNTHSDEKVLYRMGAIRLASPFGVT